MSDVLRTDLTTLAYRLNLDAAARHLGENDLTHCLMRAALWSGHDARPEVLTAAQDVASVLVERGPRDIAPVTYRAARAEVNHPRQPSPFATCAAHITRSDEEDGGNEITFTVLKRMDDHTLLALTGLTGDQVALLHLDHCPEALAPTPSSAALHAAREQATRTGKNLWAGTELKHAFTTTRFDEQIPGWIEQHGKLRSLTTTCGVQATLTPVGTSGGYAAGHYTYTGPVALVKTLLRAANIIGDEQGYGLVDLTFTLRTDTEGTVYVGQSSSCD